MDAQPIKVSPEASDTEPFFEIIDGQRVELPPRSIYAMVVSSRLLHQLGAFAEANSLAEVVGHMLFRLPLERGPNRRPHVAVVTYERWPKRRPIAIADDAWDVVPDMAVEVVSPQDL